MRQNLKIFEQSISRRSILKGMGIGLIGLTAPNVIRSAKAQNPVTIRFTGWDSFPNIVRENVKEFEKQNPDIKVDYFITSGDYGAKMAATFAAKTPLDVCYIRDNNLAEWADAGWVIPIEEFPVEQYKKDLFPGNLKAMSYKGKLYGLPNYTGFHAWVYNEEMLKKGGFDNPPETLEELTHQAVELKKRKICEYPISMALKRVAAGYYCWWALVYANGGYFFDNDGNPIFHQDGHVARKVLQWLIDAYNKEKILDPSSFELESDYVNDYLGTGKSAHAAIMIQGLQRINTAPITKYPERGKIKLCLHPGTTHETMSWTRMYGITTISEKKKEAWRLVEFMGGKDKNGEYWTAKRWYLTVGNRFMYRSLGEDKAIKEATSKWGDESLLIKQQEKARPREFIHAPWFGEWEMENMAEIQAAILKQKGPKEALASSAKAVERIKKKW